jgi:flagellar hook-length control protein FliK
MNIEHANLAPKSPVNKPSGNDCLATRENGQNGDNFASALKDQKKAFAEPNTVEETKPQPQAESVQANPAENKNAGDERKELADFLEQFFPQLNANSSVDANGNTPITPGGADETPISTATTTEDSVNNQDTGSLMASSGLVATKPSPAANTSNFSTENSSQDVSLKNQTSSWQLNPAKAGLNLSVSEGSESFKKSLESLTGAEPPTVATGGGIEPKTELTSIQKPTDPRMEYASIAKPVSHPGWSKDLGEHIIWMNNKAISAAEIKMNPEQLGPISIRIDVDQDNQASILFTAQHPEAKEALETSIPKLREMLQGQQLNLVNVNISQNSGSHHGRTPPQPFLGNSGSNPGQQNLEPGEQGEVAVSKGLLSLYA